MFHLVTTYVFQFGHHLVYLYQQNGQPVKIPHGWLKHLIRIFPGA